MLTTEVLTELIKLNLVMVVWFRLEPIYNTALTASKIKTAALKEVKIDSKIIISLRCSKSMTHSVTKTFYLNGSNDQVVLLVRGVRAKDQAMNGVVLALGSRHVGQPLSCQAGPFLKIKWSKCI